MASAEALASVHITKFLAKTEEVSQFLPIAPQYAFPGALDIWLCFSVLALAAGRV
jgi:hypothetical protein